MTFIHGYLLAGLALAAVPVVLHLITRQKPKTLRFPAFRFLQQRHQRNRRRLRLRHLLLLLLRMGLIAGLCLALARPRLYSGPWALTGDRPVAVVLVIDTSPSMEYNTGGASRLDEARRRARELLDEIPEGSQVAILDAADDADSGPDWLPTGTAPARLAALRTRPASAALNHAVERGFRLLAKLGEGEEVPPRFLYVFSDRARASWDSALRPVRPEGISAAWVDVGVESPKDIAIDKIELEPPALTSGQPLRILVTVRATGGDFDTELSCRIDNDPDVNRPADRQPIRLSAGQARVFVFERPAPARPAASVSPAPLHITAQVATSDALPFNNVRHATFLVRDPRKVLTIIGKAPQRDVEPWRGWQAALEAVGNFECDARTVEEAGRLGPRTLQAYPVACLFEVVPDAALWQKLTEYVRNGGGLIIVPGGDEWLPEVASINKDAAELLPAPFAHINKTGPNEKAIRWAGFSPRHPITGYFNQAIRTGNPDFGSPALWPSVYAWWTTATPAQGASALAVFADPKGSLALAERTVGRGHVLQLTTPLDFRDLDRNRRWHNYWQDSSFGLVLVDQMCRYLAGDAVLPEVNFLCGQPVQLTVPLATASPPLTLQGPGLSLAEANLPAPDNTGRLGVAQAQVPGNFSVLDSKGGLVAGFSMNVRTEESNLEKVPKEAIEQVLGPGSVLQVGRGASLQEALQKLQPPPVELLPWLMMLVLLALAGEAALANRFYRRAEGDRESALAPPMASGGTAP